ncbi:hypothetical protein, partial [Serratia marcescens]|uniref:hypothetical protein n=1 Tax=Serratia marcescens TaxID=615 RepID=UPI001F156BF0
NQFFVLKINLLICCQQYTCLPCGASITYGKAPLWFGQIGALLSVVLSFLVLIFSENMFVGLASLFVFLILTIVLSKTIYADRVVFTR